MLFHGDTLIHIQTGEHFFLEFTLLKYLPIRWALDVPYLLYGGEDYYLGFFS